MPTLIANVRLPDERVLTITDTNPGWRISAHRRVGGEWALIGDRWEENLKDIPRYIEDYTSDDPSWRLENTGEPIALADFVTQGGEPSAT